MTGVIDHAVAITADDIPWNLAPPTEAAIDDDPLVDALVATDAYRRMALTAIRLLGESECREKRLSEGTRALREQCGRLRDECAGLRVQLLRRAE